MPTRVTHRLNKAELRRLLTSSEGPVARNLLVRGVRVQSQARRNLDGLNQSGPKRIDTGRLRASIAVQLVRRNGRLVCRIGTNVEYALLVHDGTGLYGPKQRWITPRTRKALKFTPHGSSKPVYAKRVRGMRPNTFLLSALPAANLGGRRR